MAGAEILGEYLRTYSTVAGVDFLIPSFGQLRNGRVTESQVPDGNLIQPSLSAGMLVRGMGDGEFLASLTIDPRQGSTRLAVRLLQDKKSAPFYRNLISGSSYISNMPVSVVCKAIRGGEIEVNFRSDDKVRGLEQGQLRVLYDEEVIERVLYEMFQAGYTKIFETGEEREVKTVHPSDWTLRAAMIGSIIE